MATRELLRAIERAGSTNNIKIIKELENLKVSATDRMHISMPIWIRHPSDAADDLFGAAQRRRRINRSVRDHQLTEPKAAADTDAQAKCKLTPYEQVPTVDLTTTGLHFLQRARAPLSRKYQHETAACSIYFRISSTASRSACCSR
jgi:hypothetical protein